MEWSKYQEAIFDVVEHTNHSIAINAVAGSGKTTVLIECANRLPKTANVAFLAFNKHIVDELKKRIPNVDCMTIHSLGNRSLYRGKKMKPLQPYKMHKIANAFTGKFFDKAGYEVCRDISTIVCDTADKARVTLSDIRQSSTANWLMSHYGIDYRIKSMCNQYDLDFNVVSHNIVGLAAKSIEESIRIYQEDSIMDFTDMIYLPHIMKSYPKKYDVVLVDECQDLSRAQLSLVLKASRDGRVICVGDRNQAIQGFAGADNDSFDNIVRATNAQEMPLSICYRCPKSHIDLAKRIVPAIEPFEQSEMGTVQNIKLSEFYELPNDGDLIICRRNGPLMNAAFQLISRGIQARIRGKDIADGLTKIIKDANKINSSAKKEFQLEMLDKLNVHIARKLELLNGGPEDEPVRDGIRDQHQCLSVYIKSRTDIQTVEHLCTEIESLFSDDSAAVWLSSIHKAKGLESNRIFILESENKQSSYMGWQRQQESNLTYVALTRSKSELYFVNND